ncbi:MAG: hypothetical protein ACYC19_04210 [Acidimicrobiales bacterium]
MTNEERELVAGLMNGDASLFTGTTAAHALGWLRHPERYLTQWLDEIAARLPHRFERTLLLGMGGSSSPARFYVDSRPASLLTVLDTSNPDSISLIDFSNVNVIAASKSGTTIETQTLLAHALASGLEPGDLVVITDPGTSLGELGRSLGAVVVEGDPMTGGRFSALSPFGLVPALYAGWSPDELRNELSTCFLTPALIEAASAEAAVMADEARHGSYFQLGADPIVRGGALWLEQLIAETTAKQGRGVIPVPGAHTGDYQLSSIQHYHLVAALAARFLGVDPFNQPDVESAKVDAFALLGNEVSWVPPARDHVAMLDSLRGPAYTALQAYVPIAASKGLSELRTRVQEAYGVTTANLGPRYLHSTGQLHKGGPERVVGVQIIQRPKSDPIRISGRRYSFHDLHMAQAQGDFRAMQAAGRRVHQLIVDDLDEAAQLLDV